MEVEGEKPSSLPSNYVTIHQLKERWLQQQQQQKQKSSSKPEPENPKPKPNENAIKPTNTQNQRPNIGRVTKDHKLKQVKVDDNGSTSKTLVVDDMKNPYKNDAAKHNQRPNYRPVAKEPKNKVGDDGGSTSKTKTLVADDLRNPKMRPVPGDDGLSTKALVVDITDNKLLIGENEAGDSKFNIKKKKRNKKRRKAKVVTDQNPTGAEPEPGAKVVEEEMVKNSYPTDKNVEVEMVEEKGKEGRRYGRRNGNLRFGAEPERKMETEQEAEVVEGGMEKKSYPTNQNPVGAELKPETEVEMVEEKGKERRGYGRRNGNLRFGAESERKREPGPEQEVEVVEEKKKNYGRGKPADRNPNGAELKSEKVEEVVLEKWKRGLGYGRRNGSSRAVSEQKEMAPVDGNNGGVGGGGDGVVEEVVKERNVEQGRDRNGGYRKDKKRVPSGSLGEQQRLIWVKKGESVVPN